jgi:hypothetical protein
MHFRRGAPVTRKQYPAVIIATAASACVAAKAQHGRRILASEAPRLPLPECSQPHSCQCRFKKYADRRDEDEAERRQRGVSMRAVLYTDRDRRRSGGRRNED